MAAPKRGNLYGAGSPAVEFYDAFHGPGMVPAIEGDVAYYVRRARTARGPVLELACGTGRVTLPVARAGIEVVGLDLSAGMLAIARRKAAAEGMRATFVRGTMTRFSLGRTFRLILIPFRAFQSLLTIREQRACLDCCRRHLAPGGRLILNLFDPRLEFCVHGESEVISRYRAARDPVTGREARLVVRRRVNDALAQILREEWEYTVRDRRGAVLKRGRRRLALRWSYRWEMAHLFELCGFEVESCDSDFRGGKPAYGREQVWVVRRRGRR